MTVTIDRQQGANAWLTVALREGRNREIRRAMEAVGLMVNRLIRVSYGPFRLGELAPARSRRSDRRCCATSWGSAPPTPPRQPSRRRNRRPRPRSGPAGRARPGRGRARPGPGRGPGRRRDRARRGSGPGAGRRNRGRRGVAGRVRPRRFPAFHSISKRLHRIALSPGGAGWPRRHPAKRLRRGRAAQIGVTGAGRRSVSHRFAGFGDRIGFARLARLAYSSDGTSGEGR